MTTNDTFSQSDCQDFLQSPCQNRDNSSGGAGFMFLALAASTSLDVTVGYDGVLLAIDTFHSSSYQGQLNSIAVNGSNQAVSWNIDWTTVFNPNETPCVKSGPYNGFYSCQYENFLIQGSPNQIYGTMAWHAIVNSSTGHGLDRWIFAPAYSSYQRDWSTRFDMQNVALAIPPSSYLYALAFWMGKTPAQLPNANFVFEDYELGRI